MSVGAVIGASVIAMQPDIPVSVVIVTKNEAARIESCLKALEGFEDIWVVDSASTDDTKNLAQGALAHVVDFNWNGQYPKKRQWCLDYLPLKYDWVFFVDADEIMTPEVTAEIRALDFKAAGYFIKGRYIYEGKVLKFGLQNNKLALLNRRMMEFPVIDDLDIPGMGEIEGHYQPVLKRGYTKQPLGQVRSALLHDAYVSRGHWEARHERYAAWERGMNAKKAWPKDPHPHRQILKQIFRNLPGRRYVAFMHSFVLKMGFLDGRGGLFLALDRYYYYNNI